MVKRSLGQNLLFLSVVISSDFAEAQTYSTPLPTVNDKAAAEPASSVEDDR